MAGLPDDYKNNNDNNNSNNNNNTSSLMDDVKVSDTNNNNYMDSQHESKQIEDFNDNDSLKNHVDINDYDQTAMDINQTMIPQRDNNAPPPPSSLTLQSLQHFNDQNPPQSMLHGTNLVSQHSGGANSSQPEPDLGLGDIMDGFVGNTQKVPEWMVDSLMEMGFTRKKACYALQQSQIQHGYMTVESGLQWLFDNPNIEPPDTSNIANTINNMLGNDFLGLSNNNNNDTTHSHNNNINDNNNNNANDNNINSDNPLPPNNSPDHLNSGGLVGIPSGGDGYAKPLTNNNNNNGNNRHMDGDNFLYDLMKGATSNNIGKSKSNRVYQHSATLGSAATMDDANNDTINAKTKQIVESKNDDDDFSTTNPIRTQMHHQATTSTVTSELSALSTGGVRSQSPSINNPNQQQSSSSTTTAKNATKEQISAIYLQQQVLAAVNRNNISTDLIPQDLKMVIVVRKDLKMSSGKVAAQCCHGCLGVVMDIINQQHVQTHNNNNNGNNKSQYDLRLILRLWRMNGEKKIVLQCPNEQKLLDLRQQAMIHNLPHYLVTDAGHTQIARGSKTVLAIGPYPSVDIDEVTKDLKLY